MDLKYGRRVSDSGRRLKIVLALKLTIGTFLIGVSAALTYLSVESPKPLNFHVVPAEQTFGTSTRLPVDLAFMAKPFFVNSSTIELNGATVITTPYLYTSNHNGYSVITYAGLPVGDYNVIVNLKYQLNPVKFVSQSFTLATLKVKELSNAGYRENTPPICTADQAK